jgi:hypothetical protein
MLLATDARGQVERHLGVDVQWSAVQALSVGEFVQLRLLKKGTIRGSIVSATETALTVAAKGGQLTTARSDIQEVKVKRGQLRKGVMGAAIGAASGVGTIAILDGALTDGNGMSGSYAALMGILGAGIGLMVTSFRPAYTTIYKIH